MRRLLPFTFLAALSIACQQRETTPPVAAEHPAPAAAEIRAEPPPPPAPEAPPYSEGAAGIVRMVEARLPEANIRNQMLLSRAPFNLSPDDLIRMRRDGVPDSLIAVAQQHDAQLALREQNLIRTRNELKLRQQLQAELAKLRREIRSNQVAAASPSAVPSTLVQVNTQNPYPAPERVIERTIIREQVPVYVNNSYFTPSIPFIPAPTPVPPQAPATFRPPSQGGSGFAAPVGGFSAPVTGFGNAPSGFAAPQRQSTNFIQQPAWQYYNPRAN